MNIVYEQTNVVYEQTKFFISGLQNILKTT